MQKVPAECFIEYLSVFVFDETARGCKKNHPKELKGTVLNTYTGPGKVSVPIDRLKKNNNNNNNNS